MVLSVLPQLVAFPTATIPSLLGKRLSRAASGYTFLGAVATYCLAKNSRRASNPALKAAHDYGYGSSSGSSVAHDRLRWGVGLGALAHVGLVVAKLVGVDGGGWFVAGRGLWQNYPSLMAASPAAVALMMVTYSVLAVTALSGSLQKK